MSELDALASPRHVTARGVVQDRSGIRQFQLAADESEQWWSITYDDGAHDSYRDDTVRLGGEELRPSDFFSPMPEPMRMLWPTRLLTWANPRGSFYPILVQRIGQRSLLLTFEHVDDPAMRQTLVIDEATGIGRKLAAYDRGVIITGVGGLDGWDPSREPAFEPIEDWVRSDY